MCRVGFDPEKLPLGIVSSISAYLTKSETLSSKGI